MPPKSHLPSAQPRTRTASSSTSTAATPSTALAAISKPHARLPAPALHPRSAARSTAGRTSSGALTTVARPSSLARSGRPAYGDVVESDEVHDEIRALGAEVKSKIAQHLSRHGTSEEQVTWGVRQFGPSKESRAVLNRENEAARLAWERGVYCLWRCTQPPKLRGATTDFCCRLGFRHVCFCGHPMAAHKTPRYAANASTAADKCNASSSSSIGTSSNVPVSDKQLAQWKSPCEEAGCTCSAFRYVPNTPLEIGEGWLTRRANFKLSEWSAKCRCGYGHKAHDPSSYLRCRSCGGCSGFVSAFLCVVCDLPWEAHETVWESEGVRLRAGLPVREAYVPLADCDDDIRALVLSDATLGGRIEPRLTSQRAVTDRRRVSQASRLPSITSNDAALSLESSAFVATPPGRTSLTEAAVVKEVETEVDYCPACATIFRSATSNFCTKCGQPRPRRSLALR